MAKWLPENIFGWIALACASAILAMMLFGRHYLQEGWIGWMSEAIWGILMLVSGVFCTWQCLFHRQRVKMLLDDSVLKQTLATFIALLVVVGGTLYLKNMMLDLFSERITVQSATFEATKSSRGRYYVTIPEADFKGQINRDAYLHLLGHHGRVRVVYFPYSRVVYRLTLMPQ